jgi:hypothetical protein
MIVAMALLTGVSSVADSEYKIFVPLVLQPYGSSCGELRIYDRFGTEQDWDWVIANYGAVELLRQPGSACVTELHEMEGPATLVADVGRPDVQVVLYYSTGPLLSPEHWHCGLDRGDIAVSKENGRAEFGLGGGSFYFPPIGGPHWIWVLGGPEHGDCLGGIGTLGGTQYRHLDSVWQVAEGR